MTDKEIIQKAIKIIKCECGARCKTEDYEPSCFECRAGDAIRFLKRYIDLVESP